MKARDGVSVAKRRRRNPIFISMSSSSRTRGDSTTVTEQTTKTGKMSAINRPPSFITKDNALSVIASSSSSLSRFSTVSPLIFTKFPPRPRPLTSSSLPRRPLLCSKPSEEAELSGTGDEWLERLPDKKKPLYAHSLPCIEAWLRSLGFYQSKDDRALWFVENPDWHAQLSLDVTDLYIRYLKSGPGILEKDVERRFSYALSREDIENAILGGP